MNKQSAVGTGLVFSNVIINATANSVGVAKTGTAIGSLHGVAHTSAIAAWVGFGSMKMGMFMMGCFPVLGAAMLLGRIYGQEHGSEYVIGNQPTWNLINASNTLPQWELEISRVLNENYRQAKLSQLQQEQRERDEFWQQRDTRSEL
jgi:hypothetical protein